METFNWKANIFSKIDANHKKFLSFLICKKSQVTRMILMLKKLVARKFPLVEQTCEKRCAARKKSLFLLSVLPEVLPTHYSRVITIVIHNPANARDKCGAWKSSSAFRVLKSCILLRVDDEKLQKNHDFRDRKRIGGVSKIWRID